ncbi:MAG: ABC transporter permease [Dehalococcoidia bacterium]|nr:ABC transporter permease [Dehalococcoidia bacterium]
MATSETQGEVQHVDSATLDTPLNPVKVDRSFVGKLWHVMRKYPVLPVFVLSLLVLAAVIGPTIAPYERDIGPIGDRHLAMFQHSHCINIDDWNPPYAKSDWVDFGDGPEAPFRCDAPLHGFWTEGYHLLGSDHIGRDVFTRVLHGAQISMQVVLVSLVLGMFIGVSLGMISGYYGGMVDEVITRIVDIWYAMPFLMVALIVVLIFGRGLTVLLFVLALVAWSGFVRVIRAQVLVLKQMDYIAAARVNGASDVRILMKHLLPGILNTAIVVGTLNTSSLILSESVLSFVGAGIQPPTPAWGVMTNEGRDYLSIAAHQVLVPSAAIFLVVISLNFLGDWLRDRLDPRLRQID